MRTRHQTALALLLALGAGIVGLPAGAQQQQQGVDADADGYITAEEAGAAAEQRFTTIDVDRSGGLSQEETTAALGGVVDPGAVFGGMDADRNREISRDEWLGWYDKHFAEMAGEQEGRLPAAEFMGLQWGDRAKQ